MSGVTTLTERCATWAQGAPRHSCFSTTYPAERAMLAGCVQNYLPSSMQP